jgi:hypothetical protein
VEYHYSKSEHLAIFVTHLLFFTLPVTTHLDQKNDQPGGYEWVKLMNNEFEEKSRTEGTGLFSSEDAYSPHQLQAGFDPREPTAFNP